jgi:hypothetical protein
MSFDYEIDEEAIGLHRPGVAPRTPVPSICKGYLLQGEGTIPIARSLEELIAK